MIRNFDAGGPMAKTLTPRAAAGYHSALCDIGERVAKIVGLPIVGMNAGDFAIICGSLIRDAKRVSIRKAQGGNANRQKAAQDLARKLDAMRAEIREFEKRFGFCEPPTPNFIDETCATLASSAQMFRVEERDADLSMESSASFKQIIRGPMAVAYRRAFDMRPTVSHDREEDVYAGPFLRFAQELFRKADIALSDATVAKAFSPMPVKRQTALKTKNSHCRATLSGNAKPKVRASRARART